MLTLITTLHTSCDPKRAVEYKTCLDLNLAHPDINVVKVVLENNYDGDYGFLEGISNDKLEIIQLRRRPFFSELFEVANQCNYGEVAIISNGDIYFDSDSYIQLASEIPPNEFWTVSRYEEQSEEKWQLNPTALTGTYDCWIFRTPINLPQSQYYPGIIGTDLILSQRAVETGFSVANPCLSIKPRHLHRYNIRNNTLDQTSRSYYQEAYFLKLGQKTYCPPPCTVEDRIIRSRYSFRYYIMEFIGQWLLPVYRSKFVQKLINNILPNWKKLQK